MRSRTATALAGVAAMISPAAWLLTGWTDLVMQASLSTPLFFTLLGPSALSLADRSTSSAQALFWVGMLGAVSYCVVCVWTWMRARGAAGSMLLLAAAIVALIPLLAQLVPSTILGVRAVSVLPENLVVASVNVAGSVGWAVQPVGVLLLGAGLVRSRIVGAWVGWAGVVAAVGLTLFYAPSGDSFSWLGPLNLGASGSAYVLGVALVTLFLWTYGVVLIAYAIGDRPLAVEQAHTAERRKVD